VAGAAGDITTKEQLAAARAIDCTPPREVKARLAPGGRYGPFTSARKLKEARPDTAHWFAGQSGDD